MLATFYGGFVTTLGVFVGCLVILVILKVLE
jgi:hypothetical protein